MLPLSVAVLPATALDESQASELASDLQLPLCPTSTRPRDCTGYSVLLILNKGCIALQQTGRGAPGPVAVEFGNAAMRHRRRDGHNELLGRAVGLAKKSSLHALDATAGLGRDSFVLADLGCRVSLCERNAIVAKMLSSGLAAAVGSDDNWLRQVAGRMTLHAGDAGSLTESVLAAVDVIYLDPMFPHSGKSAGVKKEMALLQRLLGQQNDADDLLVWALQQDVARVVVKRPPRAAELAGRKPSHVIAGKAVRYDIYVLRAL